MTVPSTLRRGCEQHGIGLRYRPAGQPHFGGIIKRLIGTMMTLVHELPGTTFSSTAEGGTYDSDGNAVLTVAELQRWLTPTVASYHGHVHDTLGRRGEAIGGAAVADETMLSHALHLRDRQNLSLRDIAERLVITTGKKKGQHLSPATVLRMLRDHDQRTAAVAGS